MGLRYRGLTVGLSVWSQVPRDLQSALGMGLRYRGQTVGLSVWSQVPRADCRVSGTEG